ncbi:MAG: carbamoyltransferase C-terminal domain-containing protein [Candidatus Omnitrophota bacterium]
MKILGFYGQTNSDHDPAAVILVDGKIVAAAEEERFIREKHAVGKFPLNAIEFCLKEAKLSPKDIDIVAIPWSQERDSRYVLPFFFRTFTFDPTRAWKTLVNFGKYTKATYENINEILKKAGFEPSSTKISFLSHHMAHAASAYYFSGFEDAAIMTLDGAGGFLSGIFASAKGNKIKILHEIIWPDSLGAFYSAFTEYLGFEPNDGEYKLMGMAPFGDALRVNFDGIITLKDKLFKVQDGYFYGNPRRRRYKDSVGYSKKLVERFGPPREGDALEPKYANIAAAAQKKFEEAAIYMMERHLGSELKRHGNLCFAGGCALNVTLNRKLISHPLVKKLWVQPASSDSGLALGAAAYAAVLSGDKVQKMTHAYYGPAYSNKEIEDVLRFTSYKYKKCTSISDEVAHLLSKGEVVAWFQGKMEWGPRALGARSILANPSIGGMKDKINEIIKFREPWRPFCPSILREYAYEIFETKHDSPFMTFSFAVRAEWRLRIREVVHVDNTARPQFVDKETAPVYYDMIKRFYERTKVPCVLNTSLNRRGEPVVCSPKDAVNMFENSGLRYLAIGDFLVEK